MVIYCICGNWAVTKWFPFCSKVCFDHFYKNTPMKKPGE